MFANRLSQTSGHHNRHTSVAGPFYKTAHGSVGGTLLQQIKGKKVNQFSLKGTII